MVQLKRSLRTGGVLLGAVTLGLAAGEGIAGADGAQGHQVRGTISAVAADSFTISLMNGTSESIATTTATVLAEVGTPTAPTGLGVGERVGVQLDPTDATPTATKVTILLDRIGGQVSAVSGSTITVSGHRGTTRQVIVSSNTQYFEGSTTVTGVTVGEYISAFGAADAVTPTSVDALFVDIGSKIPCGTSDPFRGSGTPGSRGDQDTDPQVSPGVSGTPPVTTSTTTPAKVEQSSAPTGQVTTGGALSPNVGHGEGDQNPNSGNASGQDGNHGAFQGGGHGSGGGGHS